MLLNLWKRQEKRQEKQEEEEKEEEETGVGFGGWIRSGTIIDLAQVRKRSRVTRWNRTSSSLPKRRTVLEGPIINTKIATCFTSFTSFTTFLHAFLACWYGWHGSHRGSPTDQRLPGYKSLKGELGIHGSERYAILP